MKRSIKPMPVSDAAIQQAAQALNAGELVAFPTETVYGLGADACNGRAVAAIFAAKGRPMFNPLIVTVASTADAEKWAIMTPLANRLATEFWPGSLTMVLKKRRDPSASLSDLVSAGLDSVAIRVPSHEVTRRLLRVAGCPIAGPSANRSGHVSATTAEHVAADFCNAESSACLQSSNNDTRPAPTIILDGGSCVIGLESTIVDARGNTPKLLRSGAVTAEAISTVLGYNIHSSPLTSQDQNERPIGDSKPRTSPGQLESHYAPKKPVVLDITTPAPEHAWLAFGSIKNPTQTPVASINLSANGDLLEAAARLFDALRQLDQGPGNAISVAPIPEHGLGRAINDRLRRAAAPRPR